MPEEIGTTCLERKDPPSEGKWKENDIHRTHVPWHLLGVLYIQPHRGPLSRDYCSHFPGKKLKAQRGFVTCLFQSLVTV